MKELEPVYMKNFPEMDMFNLENTQRPKILLSSNILCRRGSLCFTYVPNGRPKPMEWKMQRDIFQLQMKNSAKMRADQKEIACLGK